MICPMCGSGELETISGDFETGVVAPDGYRERIYQEGFHCPNCELYFDADDASDGDIDEDLSDIGLSTTPTSQ